MALLSDYSDDDSNAKRSISNILITELLSEIFGEQTLEINTSKLGMAVNKNSPNNTCEDMTCCANILYNYKARLLQIYASEKWSNIYSNKIKQDIINQLKEQTNKTNNNKLKIRIDTNTNTNAYEENMQIKAIIKYLEKNGDKMEHEFDQMKRLQELKSIYAKLPFQ